MLWTHPRKPWIRLRRKVVAAVAVMQMGIQDHQAIASIVGLSLAEIGRIDAAGDRAIRELVLEGIPAGEFFTLVQQIRCPGCGALLTLAPCVTCQLNVAFGHRAAGGRPRPMALPDRQLVPQILLATADVELRYSIGRLLEQSGYDVTHCRTTGCLADALAARRSSTSLARLELLICDERFLDESTIRVLYRLRQEGQPPPLMLLTQREPHLVRGAKQRLQASAVCARFDLAGQLATVRRVVPMQGSVDPCLRGPP
ncbi:MAG: hypothetical protein GTO03_16910 [Planctomycetales bacterium]|nr:hypothetical protein [Planctomycetales bacterium]